MKSKTIAREFLILVSVVPCLIVGYFYYNAKGNHILKEIKSSRTSYDSLTTVIEKGLQRYDDAFEIRNLFYRPVYKYQDNSEYPTSTSYDASIWERFEKLYEESALNQDAFQNLSDDIRSHLSAIGIENFAELEEAVEYVYINLKERDELKKQHRNLGIRINALREMRIDDQKMIGFLTTILLWYLSIIFGLRYFILSIVWSIKTLRKIE